jgi:polar amino acid transport system permease protein
MAFLTHLLPTGQVYDFDAKAFWDFLFHPPQMVITGLWLTIIIAVISQILGVGVGVVAALMRNSRFAILRWPASLYISVVRGTPFLVQVAIVYFAGFPFFGLAIFGGYRWNDLNILGMVVAGRIVAGIFALTMNEGAYMAEIVRSGISSVDKGQREAAQAIGMPTTLAMRRIILPQAARVIVPPLGNQFNLMLKSTSLLSVISVMELYTAANVVQGQVYKPFEIFFATAIY